MRVAVFFEGAGGATRGIQDAGHETVGYEFWQTAVDTARANGHDCRRHDLSDPTLDHLIVDADAGWLSFPCQPLSAAGLGLGAADPRDGLPWTLRIIALKRYPVVFLENVEGITFEKHADYLGGALLRLTELGYRWEWRVLNCADYGVPQTRKRWILVARLDGAPITWPMPTHTEQPGMFTEPWVTMAQALGWGMTDRPCFTVTSGGADTGGPEPIGNGARKAMRAERDAGAWVLDLRQNSPQSDGSKKPIVMDVSERPAPTIGTQAENQWVLTVGDQSPIRLTIPELAALQGFPPDYVFTGTKTAQAKQVGNAVPPALARVIVEANLPSVQERAA